MDSGSPAYADPDYARKLKGLIFFRGLFAFILGGSTVVYGLGKAPASAVIPVLLLLGISLLTLLLSIFYYILYRICPQRPAVVYVQLWVDTVVITLIILLTGSYASAFTFLYLVTIISSSMLLFRKGSVVIASACFIEYIILIASEYYGLSTYFGAETDLVEIGLFPISLKVVTIGIACYAIAFLSSYLAEQEYLARQNLLSLESHVKRVEKTAAVGEMAAGLAHEIRNPLASLIGSIQLLREDMPHDPEKEKLMQIILREADRLSTLLSDFLLFARPKAGRMKIIPIDKAINETIDLLDQDKHFRGRIRFVRDFKGTFHVEMDPGHVRQVFWNILLNAAQAIEKEGEIRITVRPLKMQEIIVDIADTGCGIPEGVMKSIFDPFFTTRTNGSGLGLSVVQRILDEYASQLQVTSTENKGTTVSVTLKCVEAPIADSGGATA